MLRRIVAFLLALVAMIVLGSTAHSYFVQEAWSTAAGLANNASPAEISPAERLAWAAHDVGGMFLQYGGTTSLALLIAFLIAGAVARFSGHRSVVFAIAGAVAILVLFTTLKLVLGTVGIFGARGASGLAAQTAVGLIAGVLFAYLTRPRDSRRSTTAG